MQVSVILGYEQLFIEYHDDAEYETLTDAELAWTVGEFGCDCVRGAVLQAAGVIKKKLACNRGPCHQVALVSVKPFYLM